jgi:hypothetical protein
VTVQVAVAVESRTWGLRKLRVLLVLLEAKLADIVRLWEEGRLQRDGGLRTAEVVGIVKAVFDDTDYRAQCLDRILAASE